jgi:hypothetical protein
VLTADVVWKNLSLALNLSRLSAGAGEGRAVGSIVPPPLTKIHHVYYEKSTSRIRAIDGEIGKKPRLLKKWPKTPGFLTSLPILSLSLPQIPAPNVFPEDDILPPACGPNAL